MYSVGFFLCLDIELPGVFEENLRVEYNPPLLTIQGAFSQPQNIPEDAYCERKRKRGKFDYQFFLTGLDIKDYQFSFIQGVLNLNFEIRI